MIFTKSNLWDSKTKLTPTKSDLWDPKIKLTLTKSNLWDPKTKLKLTKSDMWVSKTKLKLTKSNLWDSKARFSQRFILECGGDGWLPGHQGLGVTPCWHMISTTWDVLHALQWCDGCSATASTKIILLIGSFIYLFIH